MSQPNTPDNTVVGDSPTSVGAPTADATTPPNQRQSHDKHSSSMPEPQQDDPNPDDIMTTMTAVDRFLKVNDMAQYIAAFKEKGYDDVEDVVELVYGDPTLFKQIVVLPGHRAKIMRLLKTSTADGSPSPYRRVTSSYFNSHAHDGSPGSVANTSFGGVSTSMMSSATNCATATTGGGGGGGGTTIGTNSRESSATGHGTTGGHLPPGGSMNDLAVLQTLSDEASPTRTTASPPVAATATGQSSDPSSTSTSTLMAPPINNNTNATAFNQPLVTPRGSSYDNLAPPGNQGSNLGFVPGIGRPLTPRRSPSPVHIFGNNSANNSGTNISSANNSMAGTPNSVPQQQHNPPLRTPRGSHISAASSATRQAASPSPPPPPIPMKVVIVGQGGTGKSSFVSRLVRNEFNPSFRSTLGVEFSEKKFRVGRRTLVTMQLWDIWGQENCSQLTRTYYANAKGAIILYDVTDPSSLVAAIRWKEDLDAKVKFGGTNLKIPVLLVGNKVDLASTIDDGIGDSMGGCWITTSPPPPPATDGPKGRSNLADTSMLISEDGQVPDHIKEQVQDFCNNHRFTGHFFTSAKQNIGIRSVVEYLVHAILKMDPMSTDPSRDVGVVALDSAANNNASRKKSDSQRSLGGSKRRGFYGSEGATSSNGGDEDEAHGTMYNPQKRGSVLLSEAGGGSSDYAKMKQGKKKKRGGFFSKC